MAIQFPNFLNAQTAKPDYSGLADIVSNYYAGKQMPKDDLIKAVQAQFAKPKAEEELKQTKLKNIYQELVNQFTPEDYRSQFAARRSLADFRSSGGGKGGVTAQQQMLLQKQLMQDNPNFTPQQAYEAAGNLVQGQQTLSDGTPFKVSGLTQLSAAKSVLQGTTSGLATQGVKAAQAEAEIPVADKYITEGLQPYGDTFMGMSSQQLSDMANTKDKDAQERLGKYQAAQLLQLEKSALALKMAGVESGVTIMNEAMEKANQSIKKSDILQTQHARQVALDTYRKALKEMLDARKSVGILQSGLTGGKKETSNDKSTKKNRLKYNPITGAFE